MLLKASSIIFLILLVIVIIRFEFCVLVVSPRIVLSLASLVSVELIYKLCSFKFISLHFIAKTSPQDRKYCIYFDEIAEKILKNVPEQNKKYVQKQLDQLDKNFMDYLYYWNEKYYRNGFADVIELLYL